MSVSKRADMNVNLEAILAPLGVTEFLASYWRREMCKFAGKADFRSLICLSDVDYLIASAASADDAIIVSPGTPVPRQLSKPTNLSSAYEAYTEGRSILLTKLERRSDAAAKICRSVAAELAGQGVILERSVGANLYLTPPNSQAFPPHFDDHEVLILQLEGSKQWRIFEHSTQLISGRQTEKIASSALPNVSSEIELTAGQAMYIPMGVIHEARTSGEYSLHVTLGLFPGNSRQCS
jgi:ribosomal protein L16 Arg81 hydroxylase